MDEIEDILILSVDSPVELWVDLGASFHCTPQREVMENFVSGEFGKVLLVDDEPLDIMANGDVQVKLPNNVIWKM